MRGNRNNVSQQHQGNRPGRRSIHQRMPDDMPEQALRQTRRTGQKRPFHPFEITFTLDPTKHIQRNKLAWPRRLFVGQRFSGLGR